jgi:hypothetical protein
MSARKIYIPWSRIVLLALSVSLASACASSSKIINQWVNPDYSSVALRRILVLGVSKQAGIRRTFEDAFVARLKAEGVDAVPSYRYIKDDGQADEALVKSAVTQANADGALITRLVRMEKKSDVVGGYYQPAPAMTFGFYRGYTASWLGYYEPPRIYQYDVYISETNLYDLGQDQLVWSGTVQTTDPGDINKEINRYVEQVIVALKSKNLLPFGSGAPER